MASERSIIIRQALGRDISELKEIFYQNSTEFPADLQQDWVVMEEAETTKIVGLLCINTVPHFGPIWISPEWQAQGYGTGMILFAESLVKNLIPGYYMFPSNEHCKKLCERNGLKKLDWEIWEKRF